MASLSAAQKRLTRAQERARRQALGPVLTLSDVDMGVLTNVGPPDQAETVAFCRAVAGQKAVDMLEAG